MRSRSPLAAFRGLATTLGVFAGIERSPRARIHLKSLLAALCATGLACAGAGCARPAPPRDLLLVTIDTLRADHVSASGDRRAPATPAFDRVASEGILFGQAVAPAPLTLPSHASILTGQWPFRHGVRDNGGFRLPASVPTLAEALRARGYRTAAFVGSFVLDSRFGLDRGFDVYDDAVPRSLAEVPGYLGDSRRDGSAVASAAASWIEAAGPGPIFVWVHLYDPHAPYEPTPAFHERYPDRPYAAAVAQADAALERVLAVLERRPSGPSAVVAVTADHGEGLGEHGEGTHGVFVYDSTLRVPLALRAPGLPRGARVQWQARLIDLAPTLLALAAGEAAGPPRTQTAASRDATGAGGAAAPLGASAALAADGVDLAPALSGRVPPPDLPAYAESLFGTYHYGWNPLRTLRQGGWKWIEAPRAELYDLDRDPGEQRNLWSCDPDRARPLAARLAAIAGEAAEAPAPGPEDAETLARLRALGYVGGAARPETGMIGAASGKTALPDPKDGIRRHTRFEEGFREAARLFDAGDFGAAREQASALLREFPEARDARRLRALAALNAGWDAEARRDLERLLAEDPGDAEARAALGRILERAGEKDTALEQYLRALESGPERPALHLRAGRLLRLAGRPEEADSHLERALETDPGLAGAAFERGLVRLASGRTEEAQAMFRRALEIDSGLRGAHHNLALILEGRGDLEGARLEYEAELAGHPEASASHLNLALILERQGEREKARAHLEEAARSAPRDPRALTALAASLLRPPADPARARALLRQALRADPGFEPARTLLRQSGRPSPRPGPGGAAAGGGTHEPRSATDAREP